MIWFTTKLTFFLKYEQKYVTDSLPRSWGTLLFRPYLRFCGSIWMFFIWFCHLVFEEVMTRNLFLMVAGVKMPGNYWEFWILSDFRELSLCRIFFLLSLLWTLCMSNISLLVKSTYKSSSTLLNALYIDGRRTYGYTQNIEYLLY